MTPEERAAKEAYVRDLADAEAAIPGGLTAGLPYPLRLAGNPPDPVKVAELEAEMTEWLANGGLEAAIAADNAARANRATERPSTPLEPAR